MSPLSRPADINALIKGVDRYNLQNLAVLEDYLQDAQIGGGSYDLLANLAILKLFQFNPDLVPADPKAEEKPYTIFLILLQGLAHAPFGADFNLCLAMLTDPMSPAVSSEALLTSYRMLQQLSASLMSRKFGEAWNQISAVNSSPSTLKQALQAIPQFSTILRQSIADQAIRPLFTHITTDRLRLWLGFASPSQTDAFVRDTLGWTGQDDPVQGGDGKSYKVPDLQSGPVEASEDGVPLKEVLSNQPTVAVMGMDKLTKLLRQTTSVSAAA